MINKLIAIVFCTISLICFNNNLTAQVQRCNTDEHVERLLQKYPDLQSSFDKVEEDIKNLANNLYDLRTATPQVTIPVVVHVVWRNSSQNISDAQIQSQIDVLNEDFRRLNSDASNTPTAFSAIAADLEVEFCLASTDPNGQPTTGITRRQTTVNQFSVDNDAIKNINTGGTNPWPRADYLNIWVGPIENGILGYAIPPGGPANIDGVVVDNQYFGKGFNGISPPYNQGRTATHEVGHWLGLSHVWGSGGCGTFNDDGIGDTPIQNEPTYGCPNLGGATISCSSQNMFMNYMDYVDDACMNLFTEGQKSRVWSVLNTQRSSILNTNGLCTAEELIFAQLPFTENFENNGTFVQEGWAISNPNADEWTWNFSNLATSGFGAGSYFFDNYNGTETSNPGGTVDHFITPNFNFTNTDQVNFSFDVANARYDEFFHDSLQVAYSIDNGSSWTYFYQKGGNTNLPTAPDITTFFIPVPGQWRTETVSPAIFANIIGQPQVQFRFTNISDWGNNIFIDNITIATGPVNIEESIAKNIILYPNPIKNTLFIKLNAAENLQFNKVNIVNANGKILKSKTINNNALISIDVNNLPKGLYFAELVNGRNEVVRKKFTKLN